MPDEIDQLIKTTNPTYHCPITRCGYHTGDKEFLQAHLEVNHDPSEVKKCLERINDPRLKCTKCRFKTNAVVEGNITKGICYGCYRDRKANALVNGVFRDSIKSTLKDYDNWPDYLKREEDRL